MKDVFTTLLALVAALSPLPASCLSPSRSSPSAHYFTPRAPTTNSTFPDYTFAQLYGLTTRFLDNLMYPLNAAQASSVNSTLLSPNIIGRVEQTRNFLGPELNTEYLFGLFANIALDPSTVTLIGVPLNYSIARFAANGHIVALDAIIQWNITALDVVVPVELIAFVTFDADGAISQYDASFRWLERQFEYLFSLAGRELGLNETSTVAKLTAELARSICGVAARYCNGTNTQYSSPADCYAFLTQQIRFGTADELGMNTLVCRMLHQAMVPFRPDVHCPHIGPSGGGYCDDDLTYVGTVTEDLFVNSPFVPYGYGSGDDTVAEMR